jgi:hypothetical protein
VERNLKRGMNMALGQDRHFPQGMEFRWMLAVGDIFFSFSAVEGAINAFEKK